MVARLIFKNQFIRPLFDSHEYTKFSYKWY